MIDIGANLMNHAFDDDRNAVVERAVAVGLEHLIITGTDLQVSAAASAYAHTDPRHFSSTAGVHPHDAKDLPSDWLDALRRLCRSEVVRAVGETGLDFARNYTPRADQERCFAAQIELAAELELPLFVHERDTGGRVLEMLDAMASDLGSGVVIHCFTGTRDELESYLERGWHIGITGWLCDERRGGGIAELVPAIPANRLMIETDAPFLTPRTMPGFRRQRRNEPANLVWVARRLAELRGSDPALIAAETSAVARRFFDLPG